MIKTIMKYRQDHKGQSLFAYVTKYFCGYRATTPLPTMNLKGPIRD